MNRMQLVLRFILVALILPCVNLNVFAQERIIEISSEKDLGGKVWDLPGGVTLVMKGGIIKNGSIRGSQTKIKYTGIVFSNVRILGTWDVPDIRTSMFADLGYDNSLKDVFALASAQTQNHIIIDPGHYSVAALKEGDTCIPVCSNTEVSINGIIQLKPNKYKSYNILSLKGENIHVRGNGSIIGDKHSHLGEYGEWGMGVRFDGACNAELEGLTIKDCWGDCIYVGGGSKNVVIDNCYLDHGRRQGISVTKADGIVIKRCTITNVSGTNPQYAIDVEPNRGDTVTNVLIQKIKVRDCEGGFLATRSAKLENNKPISWIGNIVVKDCEVEAKSKYPIYLRKSEFVSVERCVIDASPSKPAIFTDDAKSVVIKNNTIYVGRDVVSSLKNSVGRAVGKKNAKSISIVRADKQDVQRNKIINN